MDKSLEKAKRMFFDFACRKFFMAHDGVLDEYEKFRITEAQEQAWRDECVSCWVSQLSTEDLMPFARLEDAEAIEALPALISVSEQGDSLSRLWCANATWHLAKRVSFYSSITTKAIDTARDCWQALLEQPIKLSASHRDFITPFMMKAFDASTPEAYIVNYAKRKLDEYKAEGYR
jgi:hypothetical protein